MGRNPAGEKAGAPTKEADLYSWAVLQAELLRAGRLSKIDPAAIAEEIEEQYDRLESAGASTPALRRAKLPEIF